MGRAVAPKLAARFARAILELGGNNAAIVAPTADLDLTLRAIAFSAMGTAGQRCTTLRRLIVHDSIYDTARPATQKGLRLRRHRRPARTQHPRRPAHRRARLQRHAEGPRQTPAPQAPPSPAANASDRPQQNPEAFYVRPALVEISKQTDIVKRETFAPILYVLRYSRLRRSPRLHNDVPQGLSSSIFTMNLREAEQFLSATGSDCGIANVNIGTSGAEIGGAFGGEKETGGGRESGSDAWKQYMRRATNTINYGTDLPLAQGVSFDID